ncbi:hypothetical protein RO566_002625 [Salmonella enterica]|nr:hypothetical protein [Salmonella enterica]EFU6400646.1 hypothetical protein [Salmonella enterica]EHF0507884.1 hypothetical protein [Salmonella enterica subsp. enterica serovar Sandiego]ELH2534232.1 hypothetical protein [Salmonella enterica]SUG86777.1 Uncharacterised protein [Salmonella enterica subsp. enterica]
MQTRTSPWPSIFSGRLPFIFRGIITVCSILLAVPGVQAVSYHQQAPYAETRFTISGNLASPTVGKEYTLTSNNGNATGTVQCNYTGTGTSSDAQAFYYYATTRGIPLGNGWRQLNEYLSYKIAGPGSIPSDVCSYKEASACMTGTPATYPASGFGYAFPVTLTLRWIKSLPSGASPPRRYTLGYYSRAHTSGQNSRPPLSPPGYTTITIVLDASKIIPEVSCSASSAALTIDMEGMAGRQTENRTQLTITCNWASRVNLLVRESGTQASPEDCASVDMKSASITESACLSLARNGQRGKDITVDVAADVSETIDITTRMDGPASGYYTGTTVIVATLE